jgi:hypothetical protein
MITEVVVANPNFIIALRSISMVLAKKAGSKLLRIFDVFKWLFVITKVTVADPNIFALRYISIVLAEELDPNC